MHVGIRPDGQAEAHLIHPQFESKHLITKGLRVAGVSKRQGILRRHVEGVEPQNIIAGDRLVLVDEAAGRIIKTRKVVSVEHVKPPVETSAEVDPAANGNSRDVQERDRAARIAKLMPGGLRRAFWEAKASDGKRVERHPKPPITRSRQ